MSGRRKIIAGLITALALVALGVSTYLAWVTWQSGSVAGCTADSLLDCDEVLASRWSKWFGLPVSLLGALTYLSILALAWPAASRPQGLAMTALFALALVAAGAAIWFVGLQAIQLQSFCFYCLTVHTCGLIVALLALLLFLDTSGSSDLQQMQSLLGVAPVESKTQTPSSVAGLNGPRLLTALGASTLSIAALMAGQLLSEPETNAMEEIEFQPLVIDEPIDNQPLENQLAEETQPEETQPEETQPEEPSDNFFEDTQRRIVFPGLAKPIDTYAMPVLGDPQAEFVILEMMDYTCKHCRKLHVHLHASLDRYGDRLAVVIQHIPLSKKCNPLVKRDYLGRRDACDYAKLAVGVWKLAPEKFAAYHDWLLESEKPPGIYEARTRAISLVGTQILLNKRMQADTNRRLASQSATLRAIRVGLPILLLTNGALRGVPEEEQKLFDYLENKLGIEPQVQPGD